MTGTSPFTLMGIINVTPDSFYDGGRYALTDAAVARGLSLCEEGADILDIGGASSRPGASTVDPDEERGRVLPVVEKLSRSCGRPISIDTTWSSVAVEALDRGASIVNDISAGRFDPEMAPLVAKRGCSIILMHSRGTHADMHLAPHYKNVADEVCRELSERIDIFTAAGVAKEKIILDPGIGFSKSAEHNIELLRDLRKVTGLNFPVLIGLSRKSFIGKITGKPVEERLFGTLAAAASSYARGVRMFRVHDVRATMDFLKVLVEVERN